MSAEFTIHATGDWGEGSVRAGWVKCTRRLVREVEHEIDLAWSAAQQRLGERLFDGPMCRLERFEATAALLRLEISPTRYKPFLGTNLTNAAIADRFGSDVLANPLGLSTALESADGWLLLGRRNHAVAYHPGRVHPFAGALEPGPGGSEPDVFDEIRRELQEELRLPPEGIVSIRCIGLVEDCALRQPELIFHARSRRSRASIESNLDEAEHHATYAVGAETDAVARAVADPILTPVARATLTLWRRAGSPGATGRTT